MHFPRDEELVYNQSTEESGFSPTKQLAGVALIRTSYASPVPSRAGQSSLVKLYDTIELT